MLSTRFIPLSLFAGLTLLLLLPVGIFSSLSGPLFNFVFGIHIILHFAALFLAVKYILSCISTTSGRLFTFILIGACLLIVVPHSFLPPIARDALIHHLAVPVWWIEAGKITEIPWHDWSYYPMLLQLAYTGFLSLNLESFIAVYHFSYAVLAAALIARMMFLENKESSYQTVALCIFLSLPIVLRLGSTQLVDLGLVFYCTLAVCMTFEWQEKQSLWRLIGIGVALGLAMGCKYNGLLFVGVYFLCMPLYLSRLGVPVIKMFLSFVIIGISSLVVYAPWLLKNLYATGNPLYPLFGGYFGTALPTPGVRGLKSFELRSLKYGEGIFEYLMLPIRMLLFGKDHDPQYFDGRLSPLLLLLFVCFRIVRNNSRILLLLLLVGVYSYLALFYSGARVRYMLPVLGLVCCLSAYGISLITGESWRKYALIVVVAFQSLLLVFYVPDLLERTGVISYFSRGESREDYLTKKISEYSLAQLLSERYKDSSTGATYLLYTGNRFYYYDIPVRSAGHFGANELIRWLYKAPDAESLAVYFKMNNIVRIAAHIERLTESLQNALPQREATLWNRFQQDHLKLVTTLGPYGVWEVTT